MKKIIAPLALAILVSACESASEKHPMADTAIHQHKEARVKSTIDTIPDWFTEMPKEDKTVFARGTGLMPGLQASIDLARMNAKEQLADRVYSKLRSQTKTYMAKVGSDDFDVSMLHEVEKAAKNIVPDAEVNGYEERELDIVKEGTQYRAYMLLAYNSEEAQKVIRNRLLTQRSKVSKLKSRDAWRELDQTVDKVKRDETLSEMPDAIVVPKRPARSPSF